VLFADSRTGQPVQGAFVRVVYRTERLGAERVLSVSGTTDATGRWHSSLVRDRFAPSVVAAAVALHGNHYALATARRTLDHRDANVRLTLRARSPTLYQGQHAEFTGVLQRRVGPSSFAPMGNAPVALWLLDPTRHAVGRKELRTSAVGAFTNAFQLAEDALPGPYTMVALAQGEPGAEPRSFELFTVRSPRSAPFRLRMSLGRSVVEPGDTVTLKLRAQAADGTPLAGARVRLLSWGYPVGLEGAPAWVHAAEPLDQARVVVLPVGLPAIAATDKDGKLELKWQPGQGQPLSHDLLCAVQAEVSASRLGRTQRTAEFVLLREPPALSVGVDARFHKPSEPFELRFASPLRPAEQRATRATCTLTYESPAGRSHAFEVLSAPVATLVKQRLVVAASKAGRYTFAARAAGRASAATVWVLGDDQHVPWGNAPTPILVAERPWCRQGDSLRAVAAAPALAAPVAVTLRSGSVVERRIVALRAGARALRLVVSDRHADPLEATLVQFHQGRALVGHASVGVEPGGRVLDIAARLLWVRKGEWSGRGFGVAAQDRLGTKVQTIVRTELIRPAFEGLPPVALRRHTLQWHGGQSTSQDGQLEVRLHETLLANGYAMLFEARAPDGRAGSLLMPTHRATAAAPRPASQPRLPKAKLAALARHGLSSPMARWLAARLLAQHPEAATTLPGLLAQAPSDDEALAMLRLAAGYPGAAVPALEAALARSGANRPAALALAGDFAGEARPVLQRILASDPNPESRRAAARVLGRALPLSLPSLVRALGSDADPLVRAAAASALGNGHDAAARALAEAAASDTAPETLLAIAHALRSTGGATAAQALLGLLSGKDREVTLAALRALAHIGYRGAHPALLRLLRRGKPPDQADAARLLALTGSPEATRAVVDLAQRKPCGPLVQALRPIRSRRVQAAMARWLAHDDPSVRLAAAEHLAALDDPRALPVLTAFVDPSTPPALAERAAAALIDKRHDAAARKLLGLLEAGRLSPTTRRALVRAAGRLGWRQAGPALVGILWRGLAEPSRLESTEERLLWVEAVHAVAAIGPVWDAEMERAVPESPPSSPFCPALRALRGDGVAAMLRALWRSPLAHDLRRETVAPYARLRGKPAAHELIKLLASPVLQGRAARALADIEATDALLAALRSSSPAVRGAAAVALGAIGHEPAVARLEPLLRDADPFVRLEAAWALAAITRLPTVYTDHLGDPRQATP